MIRISPQEIDAMENEFLDRENWMFSLGGVAGPHEQVSSGKRYTDDMREVPFYRAKPKNRHGWQPTLDDLEGMLR